MQTRDSSDLQAVSIDDPIALEPSSSHVQPCSSHPIKECAKKCDTCKIGTIFVVLGLITMLVVGIVLMTRPPKMVPIQYVINLAAKNYTTTCSRMPCMANKTQDACDPYRRAANTTCQALAECSANATNSSCSCNTTQFLQCDKSFETFVYFLDTVKMEDRSEALIGGLLMIISVSTIGVLLCLICCCGCVLSNTK